MSDTSGAEPSARKPIAMTTANLLPASLRILQASRRQSDWRGVGKAIWLLQELERRVLAGEPLTEIHVLDRQTIKG